ncbi:MAG: LptF/LptG family permease, partial [Alphaproteobacteria bacterium]
MANTSSHQRRQTPTLTAYLAGRFALYLLATLTALAALTYLIDAVDLLAKAGGQGVGTATVLRMSAMKLPDLMQQLLPFAVLIATLVTLAQLNRTHELVALRAAGLPARRIMVGPLLVVLLTGAAALTILNPLAATMLKRYDIWHGQTFPGSAKGLITKGGSIWLKQTDESPLPQGQTTPNTIFIYGHKVSELGTT